MKNIIKQIKKLLHIKSKEVVLLLELLEKYPEYFNFGLCYFIRLLSRDDKITYKQHQKLAKWINRNYPKGRKKISAFWFESGNKEARIQYLKTFI